MHQRLDRGNDLAAFLTAQLMPGSVIGWLCADGLLERRTCFEYWGFVGGHPDRLAGLWVTRGACRAFAHPEGSKAGDLNLPASGRLHGDRVDQRPDCGLGLLLGEPELGNHVDQLVFFHVRYSLVCTIFGGAA